MTEYGQDQTAPDHALPGSWVQEDATTYTDEQSGDELDIGETAGGWHRVDLVDDLRTPIGGADTLNEARTIAREYMRSERDEPDDPKDAHRPATTPDTADPSDPPALERLIERLNRVFEDDLKDGGVPFHIYLDADDPGDGVRYRLRVGYVNNPEDGSGVSDLGPAFKSEDRLRTFIRGLETGGDGTVANKAKVL